MTIVQWFLSALFALYALTTLLSVLSGKAIFSFLLALIALGLVLPPLHSVISQKVSWLSSRALRIFLAIVLFIFSFSLLPTSVRLAFDANSMTVCTESTNNKCQTENTRLTDQASQLFVSATSKDPITAVELKITDRSAEKRDVLTQTFPGDKIKSGEEAYFIPIDISTLEVGLYEVSIAPVVEEGVLSGVSRQEITVWPEESDVTRRNAGGDLSEIDSFRVLKDIKVCTLTLQEVEDEESKCQESRTEIPANSETVGFLAEIKNPAKKNVKVDFRFRGEDSGQYIKIIERTFDVSPTDGYVMYSVKLPDGGMEPGKYDVIVSMQTKDAKPFRKSFNLTP